MFSTGTQLGNLRVVSNDQLLTPEQYADLVLVRIIYISDDVPEPIKNQALVYKEKIRKLLIDSFSVAIDAAKQDMVKLIGST